MAEDPNKQRQDPEPLPQHIRVTGTTWTQTTDGIGPVAVPSSPFPPADYTLAFDTPLDINYTWDSTDPDFSTEVNLNPPIGPMNPWAVIMFWLGNTSFYLGPTTSSPLSPVGIYTATDPFTLPATITVIALP